MPIKSHIIKSAENPHSLKELKELHEEFVKRASACVKKNNFTPELMKKEEYCSIEDFARSCISTLFPKEGFIKVMKLSIEEIELMSEEEVEALVNSIICNKVNQTISMLVKSYNLDFGFRKISNTLNNFLNCNNEGFLEKSFMGVMWVFNVDAALLDKMEKPVPEETIRRYLSGSKLKNYDIPEVLRIVFEFLDNQDDYSKAIEKNFLIKIIVNLLSERKKHFDSLDSNTITFINDPTVLRDTIIEFLFENEQYRILNKIKKNNFYYFYMGAFASISWGLPQIPCELVSIEVENLKIRSNLKHIFDIVNSKKEFCNAVEYNHLLNILMTLYKNFLL